MQQFINTALNNVLCIIVRLLQRSKYTAYGYMETVLALRLPPTVQYMHQEILQNGGSLSHHHGIGKARQPFLTQVMVEVVSIIMEMGRLDSLSSHR